MGDTVRILEGVRVLSVAEQYPGPYSTLLLADLGADVVQVERPTGDPSRAFQGFYAALNRNKRSVVLDLKAKAGVERFLSLAAAADVVLEGFRPGTVERLGIGYDAVSARNPAIVYVSISGYGQDGPLRNHPNHDAGYQATAGMLSQQARAGIPGDAPAVQIGDLGAGIFGFAGVLLGLLNRARTSQGLYVDVAMLDVLVSMMTAPLTMVANHSGPPMFLLSSPGYRLYATSDGRLLALGIAHEDKFWRCLCHITGLHHLAPLTHEDRVARRDSIIADLSRVFATRPCDQWVEQLRRAGVPCGPVHDLAEVSEDPQVRARHLFVSVTESDGSRRQYVRQPLRPKGYSSSPRTGCPALGEHTEEVLREWGLTSR